MDFSEQEVFKELCVTETNEHTLVVLSDNTDGIRWDGCRVMREEDFETD